MPGGELMIEWRERDDHVLMTGAVAVEFEGKFDAALFDLTPLVPAGGKGGRPGAGMLVRSAAASKLRQWR